MEQQQPRNNRALFIIVSAIAVVLLAAAVAWYVIAASGDSRVDEVVAPDATPQQTEQAIGDAVQETPGSLGDEARTSTMTEPEATPAAQQEIDR